MPDLANQPGLLFVAATLLPLLSFVLIFLACGLWAACRPSRNQSAICRSLYVLTGGDRPGRGAAYVALAAIVLAFVCSLVGFVMYYSERQHFLHEHGPALALGHAHAHKSPGHAAAHEDKKEMKEEDDEEGHDEAAE